MRLRLIDGKGTAFAVAVAASFIGAFLFALLLSATPQLHERIHNAGAVSHECAVTVVSSGNCECLACIPPLCGPPPSVFQESVSTRGFLANASTLDFSLLEHAPPARA